ncbi:MAG: hypothetical protein HYU78_01035 [Rhodocyclales bacterium]|nr:hypothetical protein [Rhodocyclales bacterium]
MNADANDAATALALTRLLAAIAADRDARCRAILDPADAESRALLASALAATRRRLRQALAGERERLRAERAAACARRDAARRERGQRLAQLAVEAGLARLVPALQRRWADAATRRRWVDEVFRLARERLPPAGWCVRHPADLPAAEAQSWQRELTAAGIAGVCCEAAAGIEAGVEIRVGNACLDATAAGLAADRATVAGRLLQLWGGPA